MSWKVGAVRKAADLHPVAIFDGQVVNYASSGSDCQIVHTLPSLLMQVVGDRRRPPTRDYEGGE